MRLSVLIVVMLASPLLTANAPPGPAALCSAARALAPDMACASSDHGVALAPLQARADRLLAFAETGETAFQSRFNRAVSRYAIVEVDGAGRTDTLADDLRSMGFTIVLPWLSPDGYRTQIEQSIRRSVVRQMGTASPAAIDAAVTQGVARVTLSAADADRRDATAIPHELGHFWYIRAYWPAAASDRVSHYGGPGPDWLDEMAAVLMEPEFSQDQRRAGFETLYRALRSAGIAAASPPALLDLAAYFASVHPAAARAQQLVEAQRTASDGADGNRNSRVTILTGPEAARVAGDGLRYYQQAQVISEYLADRSGQPAIFGSIGEAFGRQQGFANWLADGGQKGELPVTLDAMQADWLAWLDSRFPIEAAAREADRAD